MSLSNVVRGVAKVNISSQWAVPAPMDNSILIPIIAFNVVIMAFQFLFNGGFSGGENFSWLKVLLGIVLASAAAAAAFVATGGAKKK